MVVLLLLLGASQGTVLEVGSLVLLEVGRELLVAGKMRQLGSLEVGRVLEGVGVGEVAFLVLLGVVS